MKKRMRYKNSKKKQTKKTVCLFLCLYLGLTRDLCRPSASPSSCSSRAAAPSAMLGCVLCALFEMAWQRASSLFMPKAGRQLWRAGTDWKCHIKAQWRWFYCRRDVPTEPLDTGGDARDGNIDSYRISVPTICWHPLSSQPSSLLSTLSLHHLWWSSHRQSHSIYSFFYPSMHPSFFPPSLPQLNAIFVMDFSSSVDGFRHPVLKWG